MASHPCLRSAVSQECSTWRQASLDWRVFLVLLCTCSLEGRQQHAPAFLQVLGSCTVPSSRCPHPPWADQICMCACRALGC